MLKRKLWWGQKLKYTPLQWLQGDGRTQWVDFPGCFPSENWAIEIVATPIEFGTNGYCHAYGAGTASNSADAVICVLNGTGGTLCRFVGTVHSGITIQTNTQYTIYQDASICSANGTKTPTNSGTASGSALTYPLRLFRNPTVTDANLPKLCGIIQFSSVRAWNRTTGTLILDVIPVLDKNGVACFWDRVEDKLYYNQGTGSFTYKEWDITECDYVHTEGNAYIDTYTYGDINTAIEAYFRSTNSRSQVVMGARTSATADAITMFNPGNSNTDTVVMDFGDYRVTRFNDSHFPINNWYRAYNSKSKRWAEVISTGNKYEVTTEYSGTLATPTPIYVGYKSPNFAASNNDFIGDYKYVNIFQNGVIARDLIPVIDDNNTGCFYDKCTNNLFYSFGTDNFVGHFVNGANDYTVVQYITAQQVATSTSTNACPYIKTGVIPGYSKKTRMSLKAKFATNDTSYEKFICGENVSGRFIVGQAGNSTQMQKVYFGLGAQNLFPTAFNIDTNMHVFGLDWKTGTCSVDGVSASFSSQGQYDSTGEVFLNARNAASYNNANRPGGSDTVFLKFWEDKEMIYNGIPVIDSNNVAGLYDTIGKQFQTSAGTVAYTYTA